MQPEYLRITPSRDARPCRNWAATLIAAAALLAIALVFGVLGFLCARAGAQSPTTHDPIGIPCVPGPSCTYLVPSTVLPAGIRVALNAPAVVDNVLALEDSGWDCKSPQSYLVRLAHSDSALPIRAVIPIGVSSCDDTVPSPVLLQLAQPVDTAAAYTVNLLLFHADFSLPPASEQALDALESKIEATRDPARLATLNAQYATLDRVLGLWDQAAIDQTTAALTAAMTRTAQLQPQPRHHWYQFFVRRTHAQAGVRR